MKTVVYIIGMLATLALTGCIFGEKRINWQVSLKNGDKKPYGSYLAFRSLKFYFPKAHVETLSKGSKYTSIGEGRITQNGSKSLLILLGLDLYVSQSELDSLLNFVSKGNELIVFCSRLDEKIEAKLGCYKKENGFEEIKLTQFNTGKQNIDALSLTQQPLRKFGHEGRSLEGYFQVKTINADSIVLPNEVFSTAPDTLGLVRDNPNFIRYSIGNGHITLHAAPLVMSNYFLLQKNNRQYLDGVWQSISPGVATIYWHEYFKHSGEGSNLNVLWKYPATRWALIIAILTLLFYVVFESKRRQRIVPIIEKPENSSVSFVETVGRLYYNTGNHSSIAEKMVQHFLEWIRLNYYLNTNELNTHFTIQLASKLDINIVEARQLVQTIHDIRLKNISVDEQTLIDLHQQFEQLYYKHSNKNGHTRYKPAPTY